MIEVQATRRGYYGERIRDPGSMFFVDSKADVSDQWMSVVGGVAGDTTDDPDPSTIPRRRGRPPKQRVS